jgi:hypothetical protein
MLRSCAVAAVLVAVSLPTTPAYALDLTGTWSVTKGEARCKVIQFGGGSQSILSLFGPLQISHDAQRPILIHLRNGQNGQLDDIDFQGVEAPEPPAGHRGLAFATSCRPFAIGVIYYRGEFEMSADDVHGRMNGKFVGNDPGGRPISCRFTAKRTSTADPGIGACP